MVPVLVLGLQYGTGTVVGSSGTSMALVPAGDVGCWYVLVPVGGQWGTSMALVPVQRCHGTGTAVLPVWGWWATNLVPGHQYGTGTSACRGLAQY